MNLVGPAIAVMAVIGAVFGIGLAFAGHKFAVETDPRVLQVRAALPGANCGACGFPGCDGLAESIVAGHAPADVCKPAGAKAAEMIASIMGASIDLTAERKVAQVMCGGGCDVAVSRSRYLGINDCKAAQFVSAGSKACVYGCLGFGTCVTSCTFGAMKMGKDGLPIIDAEKCTGCGNCVQACPRTVIELAAVSKLVHVRCRSRERGAVVRKVCKVGCIACQLCVRVCPTKAMEFGNNLAHINYEMCNNCGSCAQKCPTKTIEDAQVDSRKAATA